MSAYFIANIRIRDSAEYALYASKVDAVFAKFNGKYLAIDDAPEIVEGAWPYARLVLIEFPDKQSLKAWYDSPEYQFILAHRLAAADCTSLIIESPQEG